MKIKHLLYLVHTYNGFSHNLYILKLHLGIGLAQSTAQRLSSAFTALTIQKECGRQHESSLDKSIPQTAG